jgi:ribonuclease HII
VLSTAAMNVAIRQAARTIRRPVASPSQSVLRAAVWALSGITDSFHPAEPVTTGRNARLPWLPRLRWGIYSDAMPNFALEKAAGGRVAGVDEVGRGPLAGPVVAAAVVFPSGVPRRLARMLDDSKRLTPAQREAAFDALRASGRAEIAVAAASVAEIDRLNILHAAMLAMCRAVSRLPSPPDLALVDGNYPPKLGCPIRCVVGGDGTCVSIAAASIVAKVVRDRAMARLALRWPGYGWETNAGYATELHREALRRLGPTRHHRPAFASVAQLSLALVDVSAE